MRVIVIRTGRTVNRSANCNSPSDSDYHIVSQLFVYPSKFLDAQFPITKPDS